jgi:exosome complex RNA-binding protein Csl4
MMPIRNVLGHIENVPSVNAPQLGVMSGYGKCACGKSFLKRSNRQMKCPACSGKIRRQKNRAYQRKCRAGKRGTDVSI